MRDPVSVRILTYGLLALFVFIVAVPLFWMVTTALKTNKDLYEDFSYLPTRPTLQHFVRVIEREDLLRNIWNSFAVASTTTAKLFQMFLRRSSRSMTRTKCCRVEHLEQLRGGVHDDGGHGRGCHREA